MSVKRISLSEYLGLFENREEAYGMVEAPLPDPGRVIEVHESGPIDMCGNEPNAPVVLVAFDEGVARDWAQNREYDRPTYWLPQEELDKAEIGMFGLLDR